MEDHVHRAQKMGVWVLINARWYKVVTGATFWSSMGQCRQVIVRHFLPNCCRTYSVVSGSRKRPVLDERGNHGVQEQRKSYELEKNLVTDNFNILIVFANHRV